MRRLICIITGIIALACALVFFAYSSEIGSRWLVKVLDSRLDSINIEQVSGSLSSGIHISNLKLLFNNTEAHIRQGHLQWQLIDLLGGKVHLAQLHLKGLTCKVPQVKTLLKHSRSANSPKYFFPIPILLNDVMMDEIRIQLADHKYDLDAVHLAAFADPKGIRIDELKARKEQSVVSIQGNVNISPQYELNGNFNWRAMLPNKIRTDGKCRIKGNFQRLGIDVAVRSPLSVKTSAELVINDALTEFAIVGKSHNTANPTLHDAQSIKPAGTSDKKEPALFIGLSDLGNGNMEFAAKGSSESSIYMIIKNLEASALDGTVKLNGAALLMPELKVGFTIDGNGLDPGKKWPELYGKLAIHAAVQGQMIDEKPQIMVEDVVLSGELLEQPFSAKGSLEYYDDTPFSKGFLIHSGQSKIDFKGGLTSSSGLSFHAGFLNPENLWPGLKGKLEMQGYVKQDGDRLIGKGNFEGHAVGYGVFKAARIQGNVLYDSAKDLSTEGHVAITHLRAKQELLSRLELTWTGDIAQHHVTVGIESPTANADLELFGQCDSQKWQAAISKAFLYPQSGGAWHLVRAVNILLSHSEMKPFKACWGQSGKTACASTSWHSETGWKIEGDLTEQPISWITALVQMLPDSPYGELMEKN